MLKRITGVEYRSDYNGYTTTLIFRNTGDRTEIEMSYDAYGEYGYFPEIMFYGGDEESTVEELVKDQSDELLQFIKAIDEDDPSIISEEDYEMYDDYPREAIYAFADILNQVRKDLGI